MSYPVTGVSFASGLKLPAWFLRDGGACLRSWYPSRYPSWYPSWPHRCWFMATVRRTFAIPTDTSLVQSQR